MTDFQITTYPSRDDIADALAETPDEAAWVVAALARHLLASHIDRDLFLQAAADLSVTEIATLARFGEVLTDLVLEDAS